MAKLEPGGRGGVLSLVSLPRITSSPFKELARRALLALLLLMVSTMIVWLDRDSYADNTAADGVSLLDALYYSTVTVTTTGYGDITPFAAHARLINVLVVTPLRIGFLVLLVGTTIEVLTKEGSRSIKGHVLEEEDAQPRRRDRLRHQGPQRRQHAAPPR